MIILQILTFKKRIINNSPNLIQKNIKFNLLYRAITDGDNFSDFHSKVDYKNLAIAFVKTFSNMKFGVFFYLPFMQTNKNIVDDESFNFSLDLKNIYIRQKETFILNDFDSS